MHTTTCQNRAVAVQRSSVLLNSTSSLANMSSYGMYNQGLKESEKPTSRVLRPPGGSSSFSIFGGGDTQPPAQTKKQSQSPASQPTKTEEIPAPRLEQKTPVNSTPGSDPSPQQSGYKPTSAKRTSSKVLAPPGGKSSIFFG